MHRYQFIFSANKHYKLQRHFLFWLSWWLFSTFLYSFSAGLLKEAYVERLPFAAIEAFFYLMPHMFLSYTLMYAVIPLLLLKGHYALTLLTVVVLFIITGIIAAAVSIYIISFARKMFQAHMLVPPPHVYEVKFFLGLMAGLRGAITISGLAAAIKLMKYWYVKDQLNLQLQKENTEAQLQLLKAQVRPHFLFNTLNNIYAHAQVTSPVASKMIIGLSNLLRYMLYECDVPLVPLQKELNMLQEYIMLEEKRYSNKLDVVLNLPQQPTALFIAPLLLLPFVENCFKHGASQMLEQPWISLQASIEGTTFKFKLLNGKLPQATVKGNGIGITNVKKRLALLYPNQHTLTITNEEEVFIVNLKLELTATKAQAINPQPNIKPALHA